MIKSRSGRKILWIDTEIQLRFLIFTIISLAFSCFIKFIILNFGLIILLAALDMIIF
ncbi:MAG: hypothetical protein NC816_02845 [Candidatus Omnitrophica bacterium]|nr:hypothetical protein [Candidatus Omnitrophota bacterium]